MPIEIESPESIGYEKILSNLAESSIRDLQFKDIGLRLSELTLAYGDHVGKPELRSLISSFYPGIEADDVLLTAGAAGALFILHTALLSDKDHLIVTRPNYANNLETPRAVGCEISFVELLFEEEYRFSVESIKKQLRPNTKMISITVPHNPTGTIIEESVLRSIAQLAAEKKISVLVDETYRELSFSNPPPLAATLGPHVVSVASLSKAYGIPGIRIGWIITKSKEFQTTFLAAKEQIQICNSVVDEEIAFQFLLRKEKYTADGKELVARNFSALDRWINNHRFLEWVRPGGGVIAFPRFKKEVDIDIEKFYDTLLNQYNTYVGPGHWFEQSKRHFRLGFGWEKHESFVKGLENIDHSIRDTLIR